MSENEIPKSKIRDYIRLLRVHVLLWLGLVFLFVWTAVYIVPSFIADSVTVGLNIRITPWIICLVPFVVTFFVIGLMSKFLDFDFRSARLLFMISGFACVGVLMRIIALSFISNGGFLFYALGSVLIGVTTPFLYLEVVRQFVPLGFRAMFVCGVMATFISSFLIILLFLLSDVFRMASSLLLPAGLFLCLRHSIRKSGIGQMPPCLVVKKMYMPWKLLITAFVQGIAFGAVQAFFQQDSGSSVATLNFQLLGFVSAAIVLLIITQSFDFDFNLLMYKLGFAFLAIGLFIMWMSPGRLLGIFVACFGYRFIDLLMFTIATFLAASKRVSLNWVSSWPTGMLYAGLAIGYAIFGLLIDSKYYIVYIAFLVLLTSIALLSDHNVSDGWGSIHPIDEEGRKQICRAQAEENICVRFNLSARQRESFILLAEGKTRKEIAQMLYLSEETVKVHIHGLYQKTGVHSGEALEKLLTEEENKLLD